MSLPRAITLQIPSDAAFLAVARMFGGSVARTFRLEPEVTDDLRLALSEICAAAAEARTGDTHGSNTEGDAGIIDIGVTWDERTLRVACSPVHLAEDDPRWMLITALLDDVRLDAPTRQLSFELPR